MPIQPSSLRIAKKNGRLPRVALVLLLLTQTSIAENPTTGLPSTEMLSPALYTWDYSPSWMYEPYVGDRMWWVGGGGTNGGDAVYYSANTGGGWSTPTQVLTSTGSGWEGNCTGDPAVVKGTFTADGNSYGLAMYYTASPNCSENNKIGVAFSNDGQTWHKYSGNPIVSPADETNNYGIGQAQLRNWDGGDGVQMWYTKTNIAGCSGFNMCNRIYEAISNDGINFSEGSPLHAGGVPTNTMAGAAIAVGYVGEVPYLYLIIRDGNLKLYRIPYEARITGYYNSNPTDWTYLRQVEADPNVDQYNTLFEAGFRTDIYGNLLSTTLIHTGFGCGVGYPSHSTNIATWNLCQAGFEF
jgi:hypothetical protein